VATAIVVLTPLPHCYHFRRPKLTYFTFETFGKKLAKTKFVARVNVKKTKAKKNRKKAIKSPAMKQQRFFYQNFVFCPLLRLC
jgi:hypothetical protein